VIHDIEKLIRQTLIGSFSLHPAIVFNS